MSTPTSGGMSYALLAILVIAGGVGGLYLSGSLPTEAPTNTPTPSGTVQRLPLTAEDVKDTIEAPAITVAADGAVHLTWGSRTGPSERSILYTSAPRPGATFGAKTVIRTAGIYKTMGRGKSGGHERKALPHVEADGKNLFLSWSEALPEGTGMQMVLVTSTDGGQTFDTPQPVHQGMNAKPTFSAMARGQDGALACAWLDDRSGVQQTFASVKPAGAKAFQQELLVHTGDESKGVCPCCPTAALFAPDGTLFVAFRNVHNGYRDIAIGRLRPGATAFEGPFPIVSDTWKFEGCPHDGPSMAIVGDDLHVVWMDARSASPRCYHARAKLADLKFESRELHPLTIGSQGNARLLTGPDGTLHAVWEESLVKPAEGHPASHGAPKPDASQSRRIMYASIPPGGRDFTGVRSVEPTAEAFQTRPALATTPEGGLVLAWNELSTQGKAIVVKHLTREELATGGGR